MQSYYNPHIATIVERVDKNKIKNECEGWIFKVILNLST